MKKKETQAIRGVNMAARDLTNLLTRILVEELGYSY